MVPLYHKDERIKVGFLIVIALIIQGALFGLFYFKSINTINTNIKNQNYAIIGKVEYENEELAKEIVPIITSSGDSYLKRGKNFLSKYSYDDKLPYYYNPVLSNVANNLIVIMVLFTIIIIIVCVVLAFILLNPLYKKLKILTFRAENIVENRFLENSLGDNYSGSLDKFALKFNLMEERIKSNISLLQDEKVNLKNIINDISHQLKTPLMALQMYNEILQDYKEMEEDDIDHFLDISNEQLLRMEWLVKTLLKYARLESNVVEYRKENISLNNTIEESINPLKVKAEAKNQSIVFRGNNEVIFYHDRNWISEALSNIIKNAIEHTGDDGKIEVILEETPISIRISINDNGEGIEKNQLKKIFDRFHKGENSINPTSIGIGLCLSKAIVKAHNGDITVESELGKGSCFNITFIKTVI